MATFEYEALDPAGRKRRGIISAESPQLAARSLKGKRLLPVRLEATANGNESRGGLRLERGHLGTAETALFTRQLATLLGAGAPLEEALQTLALQSDRPPTRRILHSLRSAVMEGRRFSDALAQHPRSFPSLYRAMVAAAEGTGALDRVLDRLAGYLERSREMRGKIANALIYPAVLAVTALGVVTALMVLVVPRLVEQFDSLGQSLPALTRAVIGISGFLQASWPILLLGLAVAGAGFPAIWRQPGGRRRLELALMRLPIIGRLLAAVNAARMARTLSALTGAGVPLAEGLRAAGATMQSMLLREAIEAVAADVREGTSLSAALKRRRAFPPLVVYMAAVGERSSRLGDMLERSAEHLEGEFDSASRTAMGLLEPAIILLMGGIVGAIVLAILLPILKLNTLTLM